jgi:uncharacterized protein YdiU (UPF0061 family)
MDKVEKWKHFLIDNPDVKSLYEEEILDHMKILESAIRNDMLDKLGLDEKTVFKAQALKDEILDFLSGVKKIDIDVEQGA